jgi:hypothetical protein
MTTNNSICLHVDPKGQIWGLRTGNKAQKHRLSDLVSGDVFVVGSESNYGLITDLHFKRSSNQDLNVYVGSPFLWNKSFLESEFFLYNLVSIPVYKRQSPHWHKLNPDLGLSLTIAKAFRENEIELASTLAQVHHARKAFYFLGIKDDVAVFSFISEIINPKWFQSADGKIVGLDRFFGFKNASLAQVGHRFDLLLHIFEQLPADSFLHKEATKRNSRNEDLTACYLMLHFVFRHWLANDTKCFEFEPDMFFKTKKSKEHYINCYEGLHG